MVSTDSNTERGDLPHQGVRPGHVYDVAECFAVLIRLSKLIAVQRDEFNRWFIKAYCLNGDSGLARRHANAASRCILNLAPKLASLETAIQRLLYAKTLEQDDLPTDESIERFARRIDNSVDEVLAFLKALSRLPKEELAHWLMRHYTDSCTPVSTVGETHATTLDALKDEIRLKSIEALQKLNKYQGIIIDARVMADQSPPESMVEAPFTRIGVMTNNPVSLGAPRRRYLATHHRLRKPLKDHAQCRTTVGRAVCCRKGGPVGAWEGTGKPAENGFQAVYHVYNMGESENNATHTQKSFEEMTSRASQKRQASP